MSGIQAELRNLLQDEQRLRHLLTLEKQRRGVPKDDLTFVGMANLASHWWCAQQAVLTSRARELDFFAAYLSDRILYGHRLGMVSKLPDNDKALLDVGSEITSEDVEQLLKEEAGKLQNRVKRLAGVNALWVCEDSTDKDGKRIRLINPELPAAEKRLWETLAAEEGIRVIGLEEAPKRRGEIYQATRAEKYPSIRWHFPWGRYSVGGVPDGIGEDFVYEYKTTRTRGLFAFMKPVALAQADLYGYFFRRPKKRVQIHIVEENPTKTWEEPIAVVNAERTLSAFARVDEGQPALPPKAWKCRKCEFRATCPVSQAK
jgi:hypothetical protein